MSFIKSSLFRSFFIIVSFFAFFILSLPSTNQGIIGNLIIQSILIVVLLRARIYNEHLKFGGLTLFITLLVESVQIVVFHEVWSPSSRVRNIASFFDTSNDVFLWIVGSLCVVVSVVGIYQFISVMLLKKRNQTFFLIFLVLLFVQIQLSSQCTLAECFLNNDWFKVFLNLSLLFILFTPFLFLMKRRVVFFAESLVVSFFSLINHFVIRFHGSPLFPSEVLSAVAAWNVLASYRVSFDKVVFLILLVSALQLFLILNLKEETNRSINPKSILHHFCLNIACVYVFLLSPVAINTSLEFTWTSSISRHGFICCSLSDLKNTLFPLKEPDGYSANSIHFSQCTNSNEKKDKQVYPDVFLILNETFCDLGEYCLLDTDQPYMKSFYDISNAVYGHSASSLVGGGTNNSEFELLTLNSMFLLKAPSPFNYLDCSNLDTSIVNYFNSLGYETTAMHCQAPGNYCRNKAYPALGFDRVILGPDRFTLNSNGNRTFLDIDNYHDMISLYDCTLEEPQFYYLLTFQNHGGYKQNDSSFDVIHLNNHYGNLTEEINEFLSSVSLSATAFYDLIEYFSTISRPVIVCMIGDHAPSFISEIGSDKVISTLPIDIAQRIVPFVIWSNYDISFPANLNYASMVDLMPIVIEAAGLPLTSFQKTILSLHERVPLRLYNGTYIDSENNIGNYSPTSPYHDLLSDYFFMEYNGLSQGNDYMEELFVLNK